MSQSETEKQFDWSIIGHENICSILQNQIISDKLSHAYLFSGQDHLGKKTLANNFAKSILCNNQEEKIPCQKCTSCLRFDNSINSDLYITKIQVGKKYITIDQIVELQKKLSLKPQDSKYNIAIIESVENLNTEASNRLLKILEEPAGNTIFILTTNSVKNILPTIQSRCQIIKFYPLGIEIIKLFLKNQNIDQKTIKEILSISEGKPGLVKKYLEEPKQVKQRGEEIEKALNILDSSFISNIKQIKKITSKGSSYNQRQDVLQDLFIHFQIILRDIYLVKTGSVEEITYKMFEERMGRISQKISLNKLITLQKIMLRALDNLKYNPDLNILSSYFLINLHKI